MPSSRLSGSLFHLLLKKDGYIDVNSKITAVTVFLQGAQVERTGSRLVESGTSKMRFSYLSPDIDPNSIKVNGVGDVTILSVSHGLDHLREGRTHAKVKMLQDSVQIIENKIALNSVFSGALDEEWNMIIANKQVNNDTGFDIEDVDDLAIYYREQLRKIAIEKQSLTTQNNTLRKVQLKLKMEIGELNSKWNKATSEIIVEVSAKSRAAARLNISYLVREAGWTPNYDIRVKDSSSPISLNYKGKVYQNTGENWENVKLVLSTGNPLKNADKPTMYPWRLSYTSGYEFSNRAMPNRVYDKKQEAVGRADDYRYGEQLEMEESSAFTQMVESQVSTNFEINIPYSIESNGKENDVSVQSFDLPSQYVYFAAPKVDDEAFLLAKITGWDKLNLMPGSASIFYQGTYTGKSFINPNIATDTLDLSLGRDPSIVLKREKIEEFCKKQTIGSNKTEITGILVSVRNTKSTPVQIDLLDQIPVSTNKDIEVEIIEISEAKHDIVNGYLEWEVELAPGETKSYEIKYSVQFPKDKRINL